MPELYYASALDDVYDSFRDMTPDDQRLYAARSPLLTSMYMRDEVVPFPHARYTDDHLLALMEMRLYPAGPGPFPLVLVDVDGSHRYTYIGDTYEAVLSDAVYMGHDLIMASPNSPEIPDSLEVGDVIDARRIPLEYRVVTNLAIHEPPRHGKSLLITEAMPVTYLANFPTGSVLAATYNSTFAGKWAHNLRDLAESSERFPWGADGKPLAPALSATAEVTKFRPGKDRGEVNFRGLGGTITGTGFTLGLIDDPFKGEEDSTSLVQRENKTSWYRAVFHNRRTRVRGLPPPIHVMMFTRWHVQDLAGTFVYGKRGKVNPGWCAIRLPALADSEDDPLGRRLGEPLCPPLMQRDFLLREQEDNPRWFQCLFQGKPTNEKGDMLVRSVPGANGPEYPHWKFWDGTDPSESNHIQGPTHAGGTRRIKIRDNDNIFFSTADIAVTTKTSSDWTVLSFWMYARRFDQLVLLSMDRVRSEYNELLPWMLKRSNEFRNDWGVELSFCGVESKTFGLSLISDLRKRAPTYPVVSIDVSSDKVTRAVGYAEALKDVRVWFPDLSIYSWVVDWEEEHSTFPRGTHDDMVDTASMAFNRSRLYANMSDDLYSDDDPERDEQLAAWNESQKQDCIVERGYRVLETMYPGLQTRQRNGRRWPVH